MFVEHRARAAARRVPAVGRPAGCGSPQPPAKAAAPAKVTAGVTEASLTTITLTADAVGRLGIETAAVEQRGMMRTRTVGGEVMPAAGAQTTVTAPVAGTLEAAAARRARRHAR